MLRLTSHRQKKLSGREQILAELDHHHVPPLNSEVLVGSSGRDSDPGESSEGVSSIFLSSDGLLQQHFLARVILHAVGQR